MNFLIVTVIFVVIFLLVFVMFSLDDHEEEEGFLSDETTKKQQIQETSDANKEQANIERSNNAASETAIIESTGLMPSEKIREQIQDETSIQAIEDNQELASKTNLISQNNAELEGTDENVSDASTDISAVPIPDMPLPQVGSEDDLKFRLNIDETVSVATSIERMSGIATVVQIRLPEELKKDPDKFLRMLQRAERAIESDYAFPFKGYYLNQLNRVWIFEPNQEDPSSDPLFESLVVAFEIISKFKFALKEDSILADSKARVTVGLSMGEFFKIEHGAANQPVLYGQPIYMAEALADSALDLKIHVDDLIHNKALPLFDFREWKPVMLRATLPPSQMFELVGWNNAEEIIAFANHQNPEARRAVAVAFRYLEFLDGNLPTLFSLASDADDNVRFEALVTMKNIANERMLGVLKSVFPDAKSPELRSTILDTFGEIGSREVVPLVASSAKESNWQVRLSAAKALHKICGKESLKHIEPLLKDSDGSVKAIANYIFYREEGGMKYLQAIVELASNLSKRTKVTAVDALLDIGNDLSIKAIINSFSEQQPDLQKHILARLEKENSKILYQCFLVLFKNSNEKTRPYIIEAIRRAGVTG